MIKHIVVTYNLMFEIISINSLFVEISEVHKSKDGDVVQTEALISADDFLQQQLKIYVVVNRMLKLPSTLLLLCFCSFGISGKYYI